MDPQSVKDLKHDREEVEEWYQQASKVKPVDIEGIVKRMEQKRRVHEMSAKVVVEIERMEEQQRQIIGSTRENAELVEYVRKGIVENVETIKKNIEYLKKKAEKK